MKQRYLFLLINISAIFKKKLDFLNFLLYNNQVLKISYAGMAELADAYGSGPYESNFMQVQVREPFLRE